VTRNVKFLSKSKNLYILKNVPPKVKTFESGNCLESSLTVAGHVQRILLAIEHCKMHLGTSAKLTHNGLGCWCFTEISCWPKSVSWQEFQLYNNSYRGLCYRTFMVIMNISM